MAKLNLGKAPEAASEETSNDPTENSQDSQPSDPVPGQEPSGESSDSGDAGSISTTGDTLAALAAAAGSNPNSSSDSVSGGEDSDPEVAAVAPKKKMMHGVDAVEQDIVRCFSTTFTIYEALKEIPPMNGTMKESHQTKRYAQGSMRNNNSGQFVNFGPDLGMELLVPSPHRQNIPRDSAED